MLCEAWATRRKPGRAEAAFFRAAAYLNAGAAAQALKDARFALVYGPQLEAQPGASCAAQAGCAAGSSGCTSLSTHVAPAPAAPPPAPLLPPSAWPAALALLSAAHEGLADNVPAALAMQRALELEPDSEDYSEALERLLRRIPEACAAALQVRRRRWWARGAVGGWGHWGALSLQQERVEAAPCGRAAAHEPLWPRRARRPAARQGWRRIWRRSARRGGPSTCASAPSTTIITSGCASASLRRWPRPRSRRAGRGCRRARRVPARLPTRPDPAQLVSLPTCPSPRPCNLCRSTPPCRSRWWTSCWGWRPTSWTWCCSTPPPRG